MQGVTPQRLPIPTFRVGARLMADVGVGDLNGMIVLCSSKYTAVTNFQFVL